MAKGHHHHRHGYWTARRKRGAARLALVLVVLALFSIPAPRYYERRRARLTHIAALDPHFREEWEADRPWKLPGSCETRLGAVMGADPMTFLGLAGMGDLVLTCTGDLSRNRAVGIRLGRGEALADILASSSQVAEGAATEGDGVGLARKYRVSLPVLTAVAQVLDAAHTPEQAVTAIMNLPQVEER